MIRNIYSILAASLALSVLSGCEKETFFNGNAGEGQLDCRSLSVDYINSGRQTRAGVNIGDFTVDFVNSDNVSVKSCLYSELPEVVALPVGTYTIKASYGDNPIAEWEAPYYLGASGSSFEIKAGEVTADVAPVECELSNIKIMVNIDDLGLGVIGDDAKVVVYAGDADNGRLVFDKTTNSKAGYFRYIEGSNTIIATFSGTVDGVYVEGQSRGYSDASAGNSYIINFTITKPDELGTGGVVIGDEDNDGIFVDASISITDENYVVDPDDGSSDDNNIIDDMRPVEDPLPDTPGSGNNPGTEPGTGEQPGGDQPGSGEDPAPSAGGPRIENTSPGLVFDGSVDMATIDACYFDVVSNTGITAFTIHIDSNSLTPGELAGVGLAADMDLINPGELEDPLSNLGFPVGASVLNQPSCHFDISTFLGLLSVLGPGEHKFYLTVTDAEGTLETYFGLIQR